MSDRSTDRFSLRVTPTVRRALSERLPESVAFAAFEFINGPLLDNPHRVGKRLLPPLEDRHSARRGGYRIIYRIDDEAEPSPSWTSIIGTPSTVHTESGPPCEVQDDRAQVYDGRVMQPISTAPEFSRSSTRSS